MVYRVVVSEIAKRQLDEIIRYIAIELKNPRAAKNIKKDAELLIRKLSKLAGSLQVRGTDELTGAQFRIIHFKRYHYLAIYHIKNDFAYIDGFYHSSQNYEKLFA